MTDYRCKQLAINQGLLKRQQLNYFENLFQHQLVARDDNNHWLLSRDLDNLSLWDLYKMNRWNWSDADTPCGDDALALTLQPYLIAINQQLQQQFICFTGRAIQYADSRTTYAFGLILLCHIRARMGT